MNRYSGRSESQLYTVDQLLQGVLEAVLPIMDHSVISGKRSLEQQQTLFAQGRTEPGPIVTNADGTIHRSDHQSGLAVDVEPYPIDYDNICRYHEFATHVFAAASRLGVTIAWGGHWSRPDYPHWYITE